MRNQFAERSLSGRFTELLPASPPDRPNDHAQPGDSYLSGWGDLNSRPSVPQTDALTKLRHSPLWSRHSIGAVRTQPAAAAPKRPCEHGPMDPTSDASVERTAARTARDPS